MGYYLNVSRIIVYSTFRLKKYDILGILVDFCVWIFHDFV